jgi:formylglycine-generating enzyme required for sulfatase activity
MSKVAIVGVEGSGKTVLMAALAEQYGTISPDRPYLMPENQAAFSFMTHIPHLMRKEHRWPQATGVDSLRYLKWSLRLGSDVLKDVEMLDYPGELYRLAFGEHSEAELAAHRKEVHEFLDHIVTSDMLVILLNLKDVMDLGRNHRNAETVWITRGILDYARKIPGIKDVLLVFTQADRYMDQLQAEGGPKGVLARHIPMLTVLHPKLECLAVTAVNTTDADGLPMTDYQSIGLTALMSGMIGPATMQCSVHGAKGQSCSLDVDLGSGISMPMMHIQPGSFVRKVGWIFSRECRVAISRPYMIGKFQVTQEQWQQVMGNNPSKEHGMTLPVTNVSWNDCQKFFLKLNERIPEGSFRFPTEDEWEYACRSGSTCAYCFGDGEGKLMDYAWYYDNSNGMPHPVGMKKPNAWGLHDMHGNVWEWCYDWYGAYGREAVKDPEGAASGSYRVYRGGGWLNGADYCRSADRGNIIPDYRGNYVGFRAAMTLP